MSKYFFDLYNGHSVVTDLKGVDLRDEHAGRVATILLLSKLFQNRGQLHQIDDVAIIVRNEVDETIIEGQLSIKKL